MHEFAKKIQEHLAERGWDTLRPSDLAKSILIEGAELLEIFQWDNQSPEEVKVDVEKMERIKKELADVLIYSFDLASVLAIDMEEIANAKLEKVKEKYPAEKFNAQSRTGDPGTEAAYRQVKEQYRREGKN